MINILKDYMMKLDLKVVNRKEYLEMAKKGRQGSKILLIQIVVILSVLIYLILK